MMIKKRENSRVGKRDFIEIKTKIEMCRKETLGGGLERWEIKGWGCGWEILGNKMDEAWSYQFKEEKSWIIKWWMSTQKSHT